MGHSHGIETWLLFLEWGDELFHYMVHNFEKMFDGDSRIKMFNIREGSNNIITCSDIVKIKEKDGVNIQNGLIHWIKKEYIDGDLFKRENWNPFREYDEVNRMYFGYRKMFLYNEYYFQLILGDYCKGCWDSEDCNFCKDNSACFELALWAWNNEEFEKRYKSHKFFRFPNDSIPEDYWQNDLIHYK